MPPSGPELHTGNVPLPTSQLLNSNLNLGDNLSLCALCHETCAPRDQEQLGLSLPPPCTYVQEGENTLGVAHLRVCQGRSYYGPIRLTQEITVHAVHCNGLHPSLDYGQENVIWMMACAPLTFPEDLKLLLEEGLAKLCPPCIMSREYEAIKFCLSPGEPGTQGHYLMVGLSTLSGAHIRPA